MRGGGTTQYDQNVLFAELERCAIAGARCPEGQSATFSALARAGRIRIYISGHNWRHVEILTGQHAGKTTMFNPDGHRVYLIVDSAGKRYIKADEACAA